MSKDPFSKLQSSLSLEDLLDQPNTHDSKKWLLTYLDVFVLIVMLVITLITLGDIKVTTIKPQVVKPKKAPAVTCPPAATPVIVNCPPLVAVENKPLQAIALPENAAEIKADNAAAKDSDSITPAPAQTPEIATESPNPPQPAAPLQANGHSAEEDKLQQQLTKAIDEFGLNKAVNIKVTQGYAQLEIQDKVLFKSSEATLTASGEALIKRLVPVLKQAVGLILIEGHTDNLPIKSAQFPSNWELGASRATSVLHYLVSQQLDSRHLRATTYADTMPIADNSTAAGREKNRRVNILIKFSE